MDGQTEIVNKCLEHYLQCFLGDKLREWSWWFPKAEWWYNTTVHTFTRITPFEAVYGYPTPPLLAHSPRIVVVQVVEDTLRSWDHILHLLQGNLQVAPRKNKMFC